MDSQKNVTSDLQPLKKPPFLRCDDFDILLTYKCHPDHEVKLVYF